MGSGIGEDAPILLDQAQQCLGLICAHHIPGSRRASKQHQASDAFGVTRGVSERMRTRGVLAEQAELAKARLIDDGLEIGKHRPEGKVDDITL